MIEMKCVYVGFGFVNIDLIRVKNVKHKDNKLIN
jgi:hypothetical protein